jgi:hypothetical protein
MLIKQITNNFLVYEDTLKILCKHIPDQHTLYPDTLSLSLLCNSLENR